MVITLKFVIETETFKKESLFFALAVDGSPASLMIDFAPGFQAGCF